MTSEPTSQLLELLREAQSWGFLGPGPVENQLAHAEEMTRLIGAPSPQYPAGEFPEGGFPDGEFLDLGSGGGLPGLVLAASPGAVGTLLDAQLRRTEWLESVVVRLGWVGRVTVVRARAEMAARDQALRSRFALVAARSFGRPAVTAECARGFLAPGGVLVVSEPASVPEERWAPAGLAELGLTEVEIRRGRGATVAVMKAVGPPNDRWPRRQGVPAKRPLW